MMEFKEKLKLFQPTLKEQYIAESQQRRLLNQLAHLTKLHDLLERLERVKTKELDDSHIELFKETPFKPRSFRNRVGRISSSSIKIYEILRKYEFDSFIKEAVSKMRRPSYGGMWEQELPKINEKLMPMDKRKYAPKISMNTLLKAIAPYKKYFVDAHSHVVKRGLGVLIDASETLRDLGYEYESALAKEGLIKSRNFGTPTSRDIVGRVSLATLGLGQVVYDGFGTKEVGSMFTGLGMCVAAVFIGR